MASPTRPWCRRRLHPRGSPAPPACRSPAPTAAYFDQGAPDGFGHALIAGGNGITFIDYSQSGNILDPNYVAFVGGFYDIDDIAPLSGSGSHTSVPEPSPLALLGAGIVLLLARTRRRRATTVN